MRVGSFEEIAEVLQNRGVTVQNFHELQPRYLKKGGYVGFPVAVDHEEYVAWVSTLGSWRPTALFRANTAEWLTWHLIHAGGERSVSEVMYTYLAADVVPSGALPVVGGPVMQRIDCLCVLALMAASMGFVTNEDGRDTKMVLPHDHPLAHLAYLESEIEKAVA